MANPFRGEVAIGIAGQSTVMRLTLGALCALEAALDDGSIAALVARFESGDVRMREVMAVLAAGLRGAGHDEQATTLADQPVDGGAGEAMRLAALLLRVTFAPPGEEASV
ncbi:MAG: gene transfer agent family protein [Pseudomonadota bacterium]